MTETVEPNPKLIEYYSISKSLFTDFDDKKNEFNGEQEWHYILSNLDQNIFLLKRLDELNLLKDSIKMVDCGIGLGTTLYDFYLQSKEFKNKTFYFTGIEKHEIYTEFLKKNLLEKWNGELTLIEDDIVNQNYRDYDIVYTYTPFRNKEKLKSFYQKVADEVKPGSILIENKSSGLGLNGILTEIIGLKKISIDDIVVFVKE